MLFISPKKLFPFLRYLNLNVFIHEFSVMQKNSLITKIPLISKCMTLHHGKEVIAMHILPNTSRSKDNQTMKFGQLIQQNMITIFLQKSFTKCGGESISRPFPKKLKLSTSLDQQSKILYSLFLFNAKLRTTEMLFYIQRIFSIQPRSFITF